MRRTTAWHKSIVRLEKPGKPAKKWRFTSRSHNRERKKTNSNAMRSNSSSTPCEGRALLHLHLPRSLSSSASALLELHSYWPPSEAVRNRETKGRPAGGSAFTESRMTSHERSLKGELQPKLNQAWVVHGRGNLAELSRGVDVRRWKAKLRMVEQIEEFRPEVQPNVLPRQRKLLDDRKVGIHEVRA